MKRAIASISISAIIVSLALFYQQFYFVILAFLDSLMYLNIIELDLKFYGIISLLFVISSIIVMVYYHMQRRKAKAKRRVRRR